MISRRQLSLTASFVVSAAVAIGTSLSSKASLVAYEGFDYTAGNTLFGMNGGSGWGAAWANLGTTASFTASNTLVSSGSFTYTDTYSKQLAVSGNRLFLTGNGPANGIPSSSLGNVSPNRVLTSGFGTNGSSQVIWISFLTQVNSSGVTYNAPNRGAINSGRAQGLQVFTGGTEKMLFGRSSQNQEADDPTWPNDTLAINYHGSATFTTNSSISSVSLNSLSLVLVRLDLDGSSSTYNDKASMWINPSDLSNPTNSAPNATLALSQFTTGVDRDLSFNTIRLFAGSSNSIVGWGNIYLDEIRIGTDDPRDVLPLVPEPTSVMLLGLAGLSALLIRRSRK